MAAPTRQIGKANIFTLNLLRHLCNPQKVNLSSYAKCFYNKKTNGKYILDYPRERPFKSASLFSCNLTGLSCPRPGASSLNSGLGSLSTIKTANSHYHSRGEHVNCFHGSRSTPLPTATFQVQWCRGYARARRLGGHSDDWWRPENVEQIKIGEVGRIAQNLEDQAWALRTSIENVYLSWVRNTYILTVAGVTIYTQITIPLAEEAAVLLLFSGAINLTTGTLLYIYNILSQRRRIRMSGLGSFTLSSLAGIHVLMWLGAMMLYLGYIDDDIIDIEEEIRKEEEITKERRKRQRSRREKERYD